MAYKNEEGEAVIDLILDSAGQKGTGKWTAVNALDQGIPLTLISEAVFARFLSALKEERVEALFFNLCCVSLQKRDVVGSERCPPPRKVLRFTSVQPLRRLLQAAS